MTRIRINNNNPAGDGGAFTGHCRPPLDYLSPEFTARFAEYDDVAGRLKIAQGQLRSYTDPSDWAPAEEKARRLDAQASAEAARQGATTGSTKNIDALHTAKRQAQADVEALTGALKLVLEDLATLREKGKEADGGKLAKAEADARARLVKSTAQVAADAQQLANTIAYREWLMDHQPWDATVGIDVLDVWIPSRTRTSATDRLIPLQFPAILEAINNL